MSIVCEKACVAEPSLGDVNNRGPETSHIHTIEIAPVKPQGSTGVALFAKPLGTLHRSLLDRRL